MKNKMLAGFDKLAKCIFWLFEKIFHTYILSPSAFRLGIDERWLK
jgi:hypothetical protein